MRIITGIPIALLACLVLLLPAWMNGSPIYWYDSLAHLHGGSSALNTTLGLDTRFSDMERAARVGTEAPSSATEPSAPPGPVQSVAGDVIEDEAEYRISMARSPYYSVIVVFLSETFGPFAPIIAQALLLVAVGFFLLRAVFKDRKTGPAFYLIAATSVSTAGVFCATLLPDIMAPLGILSVAVLFSFYERIGALDKGFWCAVLILSVISHTTHIAITALMIPVGIILILLRGQGRYAAPVLICLCAVVIGFLSLQMFSKTVEAVYGYKPRPFPMIAASVIVDGSGLEYLQATCPDSGYVYCDYLYIEARNIDDFLWSTDRKKGVFYFADTETRNQMSDQQFSFLIDVMKYDFWSQFQASFKRFFQQMQLNSLRHLTYDDGLQQALLEGLPEPERQLLIDSAAYSGQFPFAGISRLSQACSLLALAGIFLILARIIRSDGIGSASLKGASTAAMISFAVLVLWSIIVNAGITGALSNPQGRYGARVTWLLLVTFAIVFAWSLRRSGLRLTADMTKQVS